MSSLNDLLEAIAAVQADIRNYDGETVIAYDYPERITPRVPFFVNLPVSGTLAPLAMGGVQQPTMEIDMHLCLLPVGQATGLGQATKYMATWFDPVNEQFLLHLRLGATLDWVRIALITDWDMGELEWGSVKYHSVRFRLSVAGDWKKVLGETTR